MDFIDEIRKPIEKELEWFAKTLAEVLSTESEILLGVNEYVLQKSDHQLRPMIVLLAAKMCGEINQTTIDSAIALDLLHIARLIHQDVIDVDTESAEGTSINTRWTNKIATLSGDYILSKSLSCALSTNQLHVLRTVSSIGMNLSDGELMQLNGSSLSSLNAETYLSYIHKITAKLFADCAEVGGFSVNADKLTLERLSSFGECLGICYQLNLDLSRRPNNIAPQQLEMYKKRAIDALNGFADSEAKRALLLCVEYAVNPKL